MARHAVVRLERLSREYAELVLGDPREQKDPKGANLRFVGKPLGSRVVAMRPWIGLVVCRVFRRF